MRMMHHVVAVFTLAAMIGGAQARIGEFNGVPRIVDGDTVQFGDVKLHLEGIDAPQMDQACFDKTGARWKCGVAASDRLKLLAASKSWVCRIDRKDSFGRQLAKCQAGDEDIARQMVEGGWALASTTGLATYLPSEEVARVAGAGIWAGAFVAPLDWRQHNWHAKIYGRNSVRPRSAAQLLSSAFGASPPSADCAIKGNVNWGGKCIFHQPGGRWYKRITMEARYGDRWFCTPTEAIASGCRETRR